MNAILNGLSRVAAVLGALVAGGVVTSPAGIVISTLLGDVTGVVKGTQAPTPDLIAQVQKLLDDLKVNGILQGQFIDTLDGEMSQFSTFAAAIQSTPGQPGIGPKEKLLGVEGSWVFIPDNAEAIVKDPFGL